MEAINQQVDFVFLAGDLALSDHSEKNDRDSILADWEFVLDTLYANEIRLYTCRGNNDVNSQTSWQTLFSGIYSMPDNGPLEEKYYTYSLEFENFLFIALDEYTLYERVNQLWLDEQLLNNTKPFVLVAGHEPAFKLLHSNCLGAYPEERNIFWHSLLQNNGLIYFCGHDHFYDHTVISDEDGDPYNDMHQIIVGTGGGGIHPDSEYNGDNGEWTPVRIFHEGSYGYVLVEVSEENIQTTWRHRVGKNVFEDGGDTYTYIVTSVEGDVNSSDYYLSQNYPNPFNPTTVIRYSLSVNSFVSLKVYDVLGREIKTLVNKEQTAGSYEELFTINDEPLTSGVYFYQLKAGDYINTRKMLLIK